VTDKAEKEICMATAPVVDSNVATSTYVTEERAGLVQVGNGFPPLTDRNQPSELGDEQLAQVVSDGLVNLAVVSERLKPYFFELRERFHKKPPTAEIHGCRSWDEFCTKVLQRTRRAVNYLLAGGNPASKRNSKPSGTVEQANGAEASADNGKPPFGISHSPIDGDPVWAKQEASRRILSWSDSYLKDFRPAEKREIAEDVIAKLRDAIEFEAPQPPPITGGPVPEPEPGTLEALRQRICRIADVEDIVKELREYTTGLLAPVLASHPYALRHWGSLSIERIGKGRIAVGDWLESVSGCGDRLKRLIGNPVTLGRVVGVDQLRRHKIRWHDGKRWSKPYSQFEGDGKVRVLFDWQAAEKYPEAFGTYPYDPEPPSPPASAPGLLTTAITPEQQVVSDDGLVPAETKSQLALSTGIEPESNSQTPSPDEQGETEKTPNTNSKRNKKVASEARAHESSEDITEVTPHGYSANLNRRPKNATEESQPWEIYRKVSGSKSFFCCRERSRQDAEARCWKLDRMAEEEEQNTPTTTLNAAAEAAAL
jgi:hypothetical protein